MKWGHELDFALGYFGITLSGELIIFDNCPEDIREKLLEIWPEIVKKQIQKLASGNFNGFDYFYPNWEEVMKARNGN